MSEEVTAKTTKEELAMAFVDEFCVRALAYGLDSIQVLATVMLENGDTRSIKNGRGNFYARIGVTKEFLDEDSQRTSSYIEHSEFMADDSEDWGGHE